MLDEKDLKEINEQAKLFLKEMNLTDEEIEGTLSLMRKGQQIENS